MIKKFICCLLVSAIALSLTVTEIAALTKIARTSNSTEQKFSNKDFFRTVDYVDSTLGIGIQGLVGKFVNLTTNQPINPAFDRSKISSRNGIACIEIDEACWALGVDLETAVRIAHWVAQGKWRAFSCIKVNDSPHSKRIREIVTEDGLVDTGTDLEVGCGNNFIHSSLNSSELLEKMRLIDFDWDAFDEASCSSDKAGELNIEYGIETENPVASETTTVRKSWANIDFDERYTIALNDEAQRFEILDGKPKRYRWSRAEGKLPFIREVCTSYPFSLHESDEGAARQALRVFVVAAIFRTWANEEYGTLVDTVNDHADDYE